MAEPESSADVVALPRRGYASHLNADHAMTVIENEQRDSEILKAAAGRAAEEMAAAAAAANAQQRARERKESELAQLRTRCDSGESVAADLANEAVSLLVRRLHTPQLNSPPATLRATRWPRSNTLCASPPIHLTHTRARRRDGMP